MASNSAGQNVPDYPIQSVDHALLLILALKERGSIRVSEASTLLSISRSGAHRLLAMLVYRGFASRGDDRVYRYGAATDAAKTAPHILRLRELLRPYIAELSSTLNETADVQVRLGNRVRVIDCVLGKRTLLIGDRTGVSLPADRACGGRALLALMEANDVRQVFRAAAPGPVNALLRTLHMERKRGYAINHGGIERGASSVGVALRDREARGIAALCVSVPSVRFTTQDRERIVTAIRDVAARAEKELCRHPPTTFAARTR